MEAACSKPRNAAADAPAPWREPVAGGHPDLALDGRPGIDLLKGLLSGEIPAPPLSRLTGLRMVDFEAGRCAFSLPLGEWIHGPD
ncbi:MAG TPA: hypothetical protein VMU66_03655, partial [Gaiellales bacterium]|nr:hypothetical protein [Gaiellales bacterium]